MSTDQNKDWSKWTPPPVGSPCWIEIPATNVQATKKFYETLFPTWSWKPADQTNDDVEIAHFGFGNSDSSGVTGGIRQAPAENVGLNARKDITLYFYVKDIEATKKAADALGGDATEIVDDNGKRYHSYIKDPEGNRFGVVQIPC